MKRTLTCGFEVELDPNVLDDWDLMEMISKLGDGQFQQYPKIAVRYLGAEQYEALKNHLRDAEGKLQASAMFEAINEIMEVQPESKN